MFRSNILTAATLGLGFVMAVAPANAQTTILDFDTGNGLQPPGSGQTIGGSTQPFTDFGVTIETDNPNNNPLLLFNSNCGPDFPSTSCTGGDPDLATGQPSFGTDPQGNVLIIQENDDLTDPDDDADGGTFQFSFIDPVEFLNATILDLDENVAPIFEFSFESGSSQTVSASSVDLLGSESGDNSLRQYNFSGLTGVTGLNLTLDDVSGAVASLTYERPETPSIPEPMSALAIFTVGAVAAGAASKKKSA
ncbi:MAG: hypothetical protein ACFBSG_19955 [Leptolyngbyaceae cyanobacterium]